VHIFIVCNHCVKFEYVEWKLLQLQITETK
jgi:hypothetical protein